MSKPIEKQTEAERGVHAASPQENSSSSTESKRPEGHAPATEKSGGLAQFCVEHRDVAWLALIGVLVWGGLAYTKLGQQEDPTIPQRTAMLVTQFPGATASKVEELVSKPIERKISELKSIA